jgi:hypothetical protein
MSSTPPTPAASAVLSEWEWDAVLSAPRSLLEADPARLTLIGQLDFLAEVQRQRSRLASLETRALVAVAGTSRQSRLASVSTGESVEIIDELVDLVAASLRRSPMTVRHQIQRARLLCQGLENTLQALGRGVITPEHAEAIARTCDGIDPAKVAIYESRVLAKAPVLTPAQTAALGRRVRARVDAEGEEERRQDARKHIDVRVWVEDDGLACLMARLPVADAARVHAAIEAGARRVEAPCDSSLGERRAAALVEALCGAGVGAVRAEISVTVDLATLVGLHDEPALVCGGCGAVHGAGAPRPARGSRRTADPTATGHRPDDRRAARSRAHVLPRD